MSWVLTFSGCAVCLCLSSPGLHPFAPMVQHTAELHPGITPGQLINRERTVPAEVAGSLPHPRGRGCWPSLESQAELPGTQEESRPGLGWGSLEQCLPRGTHPRLNRSRKIWKPTVSGGRALACRGCVSGRYLPVVPAKAAAALQRPGPSEPHSAHTHFTEVHVHWAAGGQPGGGGGSQPGPGVAASPAHPLYKRARHHGTPMPVPAEPRE